MESYIVINGKKAPLTEEQLKMLGIEPPKANQFERQPHRNAFYYITNKGKVEYGVELQDFHCNALYRAANYCTDQNLLKQRAWHETLSRLLWRYSMEHDGDKIDWSNNSEWKYYIYFSFDYNKYAVDCHRYSKDDMVYFYTRNIADNAFEEIVKPFMEEHPDFVW